MGTVEPQAEHRVIRTGAPGPWAAAALTAGGGAPRPALGAAIGAGAGATGG